MRRAHRPSQAQDFMPDTLQDAHSSRTVSAPTAACLPTQPGTARPVLPCPSLSDQRHRLPIRELPGSRAGIGAVDKPGLVQWRLPQTPRDPLGAHPGGAWQNLIRRATRGPVRRIGQGACLRSPATDT